MEQLYSICWNITSKCNENCKFCYRKICKDNSLEENKKIFDNISQIKIDKITFSGGEPLLYPYLFELINYIKLKRPEIKLSLTTNGGLIDDNIINKIIDLFDWVSFSIDSVNDIENRKIGRGSSHFMKVVTLLEKFDGKINIKINTIASKYNIKELEEIYNIILKYQIKRWKIFRFYPIRNAEKYQELFYLNDRESKLIEKYVLEKQKNSLGVKIHYNDFNEFETSYFNIYPDGGVENNKNEVVGNLLYDDILEVLNTKKMELVNHRLRKTLMH